MISTVPGYRWDATRFYSSEILNPNTSYSNHGGFVDDIGYFDAEFFGISEIEALTMDSQQRIILELTQELIDRAGYKKEKFSGTKTGVYIGAKDNNYVRNNYHLIPTDGLQHVIVNSISNMIASRVSDFYNLTGESKIVDTACSSSLVSIHDACRSILEGKSDIAIAGGIFLLIDPFMHIGFSKAQVLSNDGKSYVFDQRANGFVLGEGCGLVMLKDYNAALNDHDQVLGIILGSAVNNDGKTMGVTVPNQAGQKAVIESAIKASGITPDTIGYFEAHGTGTLLGDPIEIKAASEIYRKYTNKREYCVVGSVKSNLWHTMTAAGVTSLIKVILSLQNQQIPATLHCNKPHPRFGFKDSPFYPNTKIKPWKTINKKRRAAVSSFGFGGTNCHMIIEGVDHNQQSLLQLREQLSPTILKRKWYWLGEEVTTELEGDGIHGRFVSTNETVEDEGKTDVSYIEDYLATKIKNILNLDLADNIDREINFMKQGIDSVQLVKLSGELETEFGIELYPTHFFECQNLHELAKYFLENYRDEIESYLKPFNTTTIKHTGVVKKTITNTVNRSIGNPISWSNISIDKPNQKQLVSPVAIIGLSCNLPGSPDINSFWKNLVEKRDLVTEVSKERWDWREYCDETGVNKISTRWGGFIKDIDKFDPGFFNISRREVELMDPQQRIFLQCVWEVIEDSGYKASDLSGTNTGGFVGVANKDYQELIRKSGKYAEAFASTGESHSILANRISYLLNINGPSEPIDTACSSSLVAIHRAVEGIQNGNIEMAIAGGVNAILTPGLTLSFAKAGMLSDDGRCKAFDKRANGYVRGEGVGVVFLKSVDHAQKDVDHIYGAIRSTAVNHGGLANSLTAPNINAQKHLLIKAYEKAGIDPTSVSYIETHCTGTTLGDPVEIRGLKEAFKELYKRNNSSQTNEASCALGSVKTNIGHLETAAGIAGVLKVLMSMKYGKLPGNVHLTDKNPHIDLKDTPFYLLKDTEEWKRVSYDNNAIVPRIAGVSSFGFGGSNAHIVIEEYLPEEKEPKYESNIINKTRSAIVLLSAKNSERLKAYAEKMITFLKHEEENRDEALKLSLMDISYTLQMGREAMNERVVFIVESIKELIGKLESYISGKAIIGDFYQGRLKINGNTMGSFKTDEDSQEMIKRWIAKGKIKKLSDLWANGIDFDWNLLYGPVKPKRVNLPTYPFSKERYWLPDLEQIDGCDIIKQDNTNIIINDKKHYNLKGKVSEEIVILVSRLLKTKPGEIDVKSNLSEYGFDSILLTEFINKLNAAFGLTLVPAIFFAHSNLDSLVDYIIEKHNDKLKIKWNSFEAYSRTDSLPLETASHKNLQTNLENKGSSFKPQMKISENEPIAIIGMDAIFPQADDLDKLLKILIDGKDCITEIEQERLDWYGDNNYCFEDGEKRYMKWGGFINDIDKFDPMFFDISPREAELMDPQQRLFLQCVWLSIEHAGYNPKNLQGSKTGVFVGAELQDYNNLLMQHQIVTEAYSVTGGAPSVIANRISYLLGLHGPSETVSTACSSSLVAVHHAVKSIRLRECDQAVAGGVNVIINPKISLALSKAGVLSEDGRCKTFSNNANGYVRSEGVGAILLKLLSKAEHDGDTIYAIIKGSAENHGGHTNSLTAPNPKAQAQLLKTAYCEAGVSPDTVGYIEAHGTGTKLGDPVEIDGLKSAFEQLFHEFNMDCKKTHYCALGSVKSNIGHLETAAGIAGILKVIIAMRNKIIPKTLHCDTLNPFIELENTPFYIAQYMEKWKCIKDSENQDLPRRAGVNSFGFGESYAHVVLEEYPTVSPTVFHKNNSLKQSQLLISLSAKNIDRLKVYAGKLLEFVKQCDKPGGQPAVVTLVNIAYTLQIGREAMNNRVAFIVKDLNELKVKLNNYIIGEQGTAGLWHGDEENEQETIKIITSEEVGSLIVNKWIDNNELNKLAEYWTKGLKVDWKRLYNKEKTTRVALPTYPFDKQRYWISESKKYRQNILQQGVEVLHPLVQRNISDLNAQRFNATFTGHEFFLRDHNVNGKMVLPAVAFLEMARAAGELSAKK